MKSEHSGISSSTAAITDAIKLLIERLPESEKDHVFNEIAKLIYPVSAERSGIVLKTISELVRTKNEWTVEELKSAIKQAGLEVKAKEIYNAISYLKKIGRVRRIGYGRYLVDGVEVDTIDEFGEESARYEDEYRTK